MKLSIILAVVPIMLTLSPAAARDVSEYRVVHPSERWTSPEGGLNLFDTGAGSSNAVGFAYTMLMQNEPEKAIGHLENAASKGDALAMRALGQLYANGRLPYGRGVVVPVDDLKALNWFTAAAGAGDPPSMYLLGYMYQKNTLLAANAEKSGYWLDRAAQSGDYRVKQAVRKIAVIQ
jgi:TPR repeat protein